MRFFIYIPGDDRADPKKLDAVGLAHLQAGASFIPTGEGPDGHHGVVVSWPNTSLGPVAYLPAQQEWTAAIPYEEYPPARYWIGFMKGHPPTPEDLAKPVQIPGYKVPLGDGRQWMFPAAAHLPQSCRKGADGKWFYEVQAEYQAFFEESYQWYLHLFRSLFQDPTTVRVDPSAPDYLERALGMNYLLTPEVVTRLDLFNTNTMGPALMATVDGQLIRDEDAARLISDDAPDGQKKSDTPPAGSSS